MHSHEKGEIRRGVDWWTCRDLWWLCRDAEVLSLFAAIINKLREKVQNEVPRIFEAVFECTLTMITKNFEVQPFHIPFPSPDRKGLSAVKLRSDQDIMVARVSAQIKATFCVVPQSLERDPNWESKSAVCRQQARRVDPTQQLSMDGNFYARLGLETIFTQSTHEKLCA